MDTTKRLRIVRFKTSLLFTILVLFAGITPSKGQSYSYQLSPRADSIVQLLWRGIGVEDANVVLDKLKNQRSIKKIAALKARLESVGADERLEMELNERLGRESKWVDSSGDSYKYYTRALYLAEKLKDERTIAIACFEIGNIIRLGTLRNRPFEPYFKRAIEIFETLDDPLGKSYQLYATLILEDDANARIGYVQEAIEILKANLDRSDTLMMESLARHLNVAGIYQQGEQKIRALEEGLSIARDIANYLLQAYILNNIGHEYRVKQACERAIPYHLEALDVSVTGGIIGLAANSFNNLSLCHRDLGMYKEALGFYNGLFFLQLEVNSNAYYENLAELEVSHEVDRVELQNELLLSEQKLQGRQRVILIIISVLLLVIAGFVFWSRRKIGKTNEKLQALDKVKSRFFANISHELRTPLTLINAPLESLVHNGKIEDPEVRETLEIATRNGVGLLSLVEEILDLAKLDGGRLELVENPVRIHDFVELILSDYQSGLQQKSIRLKYDFRLNPQLAIFMDERRCAKVLNNLLSNALKFTPEGGEITVLVDERTEDNVLFIKVTDNGPGIHPDDLPYIFDRYYQSEQPGKKAEGGTGIGLALAKELAVLHGGGLTAESELGKGSTFTFTLPVKEVYEETIVPLTSVETKALNQALTEMVLQYNTRFEIEKPVLLVTEDHPEMRAFIAKTLAPYFDVRQAENGKVALELLKSERIDIVISDVMMPVMDGFELLEAIKKDASLHQVSLIMLTARADHDDKLYALTLGIDDYLTKPFSASEFLARIKNILENRIKIIRELDKTDVNVDLKALTKQYGLVEREVEILGLLAQRYTNPQIAEALFISRNTVKFHIKNLFGKMGIKSRQEVAGRWRTDS
jgi:signal transduction histidine kinase/DNA-binding NarL/FixJ family response regulator